MKIVSSCMVLVGLVLASWPARSATFVVTTPDDSGAGTLRQAITDANASAGADVIQFDIAGGGLATINLASALPEITEAITIDGTTQPDYAGTPLIVLNGQGSAFGSNGLHISGGGTTVRGLVVHRFSGNGIFVTGPGSNIIEGNYIGVDVAGTSSASNSGHGIWISGSPDNLIGGTTEAARNVISGNFGRGIYISGIESTGNQVQGNFVGTTASGTGKISNFGGGVEIDSGSGNTIGGVVAGARNLISGQSSNGTVLNNSNDNVIAGNWIGPDFNGAAGSGNATGISLNGTSSGNQIGGLGAGEANLIAHNTNVGVFVSFNAVNNVIRGNSIHSNGAMGIDTGSSGVTPNDAGDADTGGNGLQNFPELTSASLTASNTMITGTLNSSAGTEFQIDFYANRSQDATGHGEGEEHLGSTVVTTDAEGNATISVTVSPATVGRHISATATGPSGNTSEFSRTISATSALSGTTFTVTNTDDSGPGSLRQAVLDANAHLGDDTIEFALSGDAPFTIVPATALPTITDPVVIDGTSQPGFSGTPVVFIDGGASSTFQTSLLTITAGNSTIRGLGIIRSRLDGVDLSLGGNNVIQGNVIGLDSGGEFAGNSRHGILISNSGGNLIGGPGAGDGNVISGNTSFSSDGILIFGPSSTQNTVQGNFIGTDRTAALVRGNGSDGIQVQDGASDNVIGGTGPGEANVIAHNRERGVIVISFSAENPVRNAVRGNLIYFNGGLGIQHGFNASTNDDGDADGGPNESQNFPLITGAAAAPGNVSIQGGFADDGSTLANTEFHLDFFANQTVDSSGYSEGLQYLGSTSVTTDPNGDAAFDVSFPVQPVGQFFTVTATDPLGNTSEFSPVHRLDSSTVPPVSFTVTSAGNEGPGSLREAITGSNANVASGPNVIDFEVPGDGPHVIGLTTVLPEIVQPVRIDATTQTGFNGAPLIELTRDPGLTFLSGTGLRITGGNSTVRGLAITGFSEDGILLTSEGGNTVQGNYIGVDLSGTARKDNSRHGIAIINSSDNLIGGTAPGTANLISGRTVGSSYGVYINDASFSGPPTTFNNQVLGNYIGTDPTGTINLGVGGSGVSIISSSQNSVRNNVIAYNGSGVALQGGNRSVGNTISENSIGNNTSAGISLGFSFQLENDDLDADDGENRLQNFPVITSATLNADSTVVGGALNSLPDTQFTLEFFANQFCDSSGNGEGQQFLGSTVVTTDSSGNASFSNVSMNTRAIGRYITATATDPEGNTSQFSACFQGMPTAPGVTFTVTNTSDGGEGSLRAALTQVNRSPVAAGNQHMVQFAIPGGAPFSIELATVLPPVIEPLIIDGTSQPGFAGTPLIELDGSAAGGFSNTGIEIAGGNSVVQGLSIIGFSNIGIKLTGSGFNIVQGNFIGLDSTGAAIAGNGRGLVLEDASENVIGGETESERNFISGNNSHGIEISGVGSTGNVVVGNTIGLDIDGGIARNNGVGVRVANAPGNIIGGTTGTARNINSGNGSAGVSIEGASFGTNTATDNQVLGNFIGTDPTGTEGRANSSGGVSLSGLEANTLVNGNLISGNSGGFNSPGISISGSRNTVTGNLIGTDVTGSLPLGNAREGVIVNTGSFNQIGGGSPELANVIAYNGADGVRLNDFSGRSNSILGNSVHSNLNLGINLGFDAVTLNDEGDADQGANLLQNFPVLSGATANIGNTLIQGSLNSLPDSEYRVEFFASFACDPLGFGEGRKFLGSTQVTTDSSGNGFFDVDLSTSVANGGGFITATATDPDGNTSEFSACLAANVTIPGVTFTVTNLEDSGEGSLRQAILDSNETVSSGNTINFEIPPSQIDENGSFTIAPLTALPQVIVAVTIDGYSQSGASVNTLAQGSNANINVRLDGANATMNFTQANGLHLAGQGITVRGLAITGWTNGVLITGSDNHVEGCSIGTDSTGTQDLQNSAAGVRLQNNASGNFIGGTGPGQRNLISGNVAQGIYLNGAHDNEVLGNLIGTDATGLQAQQNGSPGILIDNQSTGNVVGNTSGGGNVIAFNGNSGVEIIGSGVTTINNSIRGNSIFSNSALGINLRGGFQVDANDAQDADSGPNLLQNYPVITGATINANSTVLGGTLNSSPDSSFFLDFYSNAIPETNGHGEGRQFLGTVSVLTDSNGDAAFNESLPVIALYDFITATATDENGNTSEFSASFEGEVNAPSLFVSNVNITEGDPSAGATVDAVFRVFLDTASGSDVSFDYETVADTATAGLDYQTVSGQSAIPAGQTSVDITVPVNSDLALETDEVFNLVLSNTSGARPLDTLGRGTIEDDDDPAMSDGQIAIESFEYIPGDIGGQNGGTGWANAWRASFDPVVEPGLFYTDAFGQKLDVFGNALSDFALSSSRMMAAEYGDPGSRVYISFLARTEGTGAGGLQLVDTTTITGGTQEDLKMFIGKISNQPNWAVRTFGVGGRTGTSSVPADQDAFIVVCLEFTHEQVQAALFVNPPLSGLPDVPDAVATGAALKFDRITLTSSSVTFIDEIRVGKTWSSVTPLSFPRLNIADASMTEGDSGTRDFVFDVTLSQASEDAVTVDFSTSDGSAAAGSDYASGSGTLIFSPGETSKQVIVAVSGDLEEEQDEEFFVTLSSAQNANINDAQGTGTILDDDTPPEILTFDTAAFEGASGTTSTAVFTVMLSHTYKDAVSVDYATTGLTATDGADYENTDGTLTFAPGEFRKTIPVTIRGDDVQEDYEKFVLRFSGPVNAYLNSPAVVGTVADDDFSFESVLATGDLAPGAGEECRTFSAFLTAPVINQSGLLVFVAETEPCSGATGTSTETGIFSVDKAGNVRRLASDRFNNPGEPPFNANFSALNLSDEGFLTFFAGITRPEVTVGPGFDIHVQDDFQPRHISFNSMTGEYIYHDCAKGILLQGTGIITKDSCVITLTDSGANPESPDRLVEVTVNMNPEDGTDCLYDALARIATTAYTSLTVIRDSDVRDSLPDCPEEVNPGNLSLIDGIVGLDPEGHYVTGIFLGEIVGDTDALTPQAVAQDDPSSLSSQASDSPEARTVYEFFSFCPPLLVGNTIYGGFTDELFERRTVRARIRTLSERLTLSSESSDEIFAAGGGHGGGDFRLGPPGWPVAADGRGAAVFDFSTGLQAWLPRERKTVPLLQREDLIRVDGLERRIQSVYGDAVSISPRKIILPVLTTGVGGSDFREDLAFRYIDGPDKSKSFEGASVPENVFQPGESMYQTYFTPRFAGFNLAISGLYAQTQNYEVNGSEVNYSYNFHASDIAGIISTLTGADPNTASVTDCFGLVSKDEGLTIQIGVPGAGFQPFLGHQDQVSFALGVEYVDRAEIGSFGGNGLDGKARYAISSEVGIKVDYFNSSVGQGIVRGKTKADPTPQSDSDGDFLTDLMEINYYLTNPLNADSDGDRVSDGKETQDGTNPLDGTDRSGPVVFAGQEFWSVGNADLMMEYGKGGHGDGGYGEARNPFLEILNIGSTGTDGVSTSYDSPVDGWKVGFGRGLNFDGFGNSLSIRAEYKLESETLPRVAEFTTQNDNGISRFLMDADEWSVNADIGYSLDDALQFHASISSIGEVFTSGPDFEIESASVKHVPTGLDVIYQLSSPVEVTPAGSAASYEIDQFQIGFSGISIGGFVRNDILWANYDRARIDDVQTFSSDVGISGLGNAQLWFLPDMMIKATHFGASGSDGIAGQLPDGTIDFSSRVDIENSSQDYSGEARLWAIGLPVSFIPPISEQTLSAAADPEPVEMAIGSAGFSHTGGQTTFSADFSAIGSANVIVEVYDNGIFVGSATVPGGEAAATLDYVPNSDAELNGVGALSSTALPCIVFTLDKTVTFTPAGGDSLVGDEIRFCAETSDFTILELTRFSLTAANIESLTIFEIQTTTVPGSDLSLSISFRQDGMLEISWEGDAVLQYASELGGEWTGIPGATSPYPVSPSGEMRFFRLLAGPGGPETGLGLGVPSSDDLDLVNGSLRLTITNTPDGESYTIWMINLRTLERVAVFNGIGTGQSLTLDFDLPSEEVPIFTNGYLSTDATAWTASSP